MSIDVSVLEDLEGKDESRGEREKCCSKEPFDVPSTLMYSVDQTALKRYPHRETQINKTLCSVTQLAAG